VCVCVCVCMCVQGSPVVIRTPAHLNMTGRSTTARKREKIEVLLRDDAWPQTSLSTRKAVATVGWTVPPDPVYSPDLGPPDFHLFGPLKVTFRGRRFTEEHELKHGVREELRRSSKEFYATGIQRSMHKWRNCVDNRGYFMEK